MIEINNADGTKLYARPEGIVAIVLASRFAKTAQNSAIVCAGGAITASVTDIEAERVLAILRSLKPESFVDAKPAGLMS